MHWSSKKMQSGKGDLYHLSSCQQKCYFCIIQLLRMEAHNNRAPCKYKLTIKLISCARSRGNKHMYSEICEV